MLSAAPSLRPISCRSGKPVTPAISTIPIIKATSQVPAPAPGSFVMTDSCGEGMEISFIRSWVLLQRYLVPD